MPRPAAWMTAFTELTPLSPRRSLMPAAFPSCPFWGQYLGREQIEHRDSAGRNRLGCLLLDRSDEIDVCLPFRPWLAREDLLEQVDR